MFRLFVFITAVALYPVSSVFAEETKLKELCLALNNSQNAKNDANYIGGVDVHGNSVVSADINTHALVPIYNPVTIPIEVDLALRYGLNLPVDVELKPTVADIKIFADERVQYNGVDISQDIKTFCTSYHGQTKKNQFNQTEQHGHESSDPVLSSDKIEGQYPEYIDKNPHYND